MNSAENATLGQRWAEAQFVLLIRQILGTELRAKDAAIEGSWNGTDEPTIDILGVEPVYAREGQGMQTGVNLVCREYIA